FPYTTLFRSQLTAFTDLGQHGRVDRLAVKWLLTGDLGVAEPRAPNVIRVPMDGHQDLVPAFGPEHDAVVGGGDMFRTPRYRTQHDSGQSVRRNLERAGGGELGFSAGGHDLL